MQQQCFLCNAWRCVCVCVCVCVRVCMCVCVLLRLTSFACQLSTHCQKWAVISLSEIITSNTFTSLCCFVAVLRLHPMQCTSAHRFLVDPEGALIAIYDCPMEYDRPLYFCPMVSIFLCFCLFSSPNLSGRRLDVYHTSTHGVASVRFRMHVWSVLHAARWKHKTQKWRTIAQLFGLYLRK